MKLFFMLKRYGFLWHVWTYMYEMDQRCIIDARVFKGNVSDAWWGHCLSFTKYGANLQFQYRKWVKGTVHEWVLQGPLRKIR